MSKEDVLGSKYMYICLLIDKFREEFIVSWVDIFQVRKPSGVLF